jgi:hypothetical protein
VDPLFEVHMLNDTGKTKAKVIATLFNDCLTQLSALCPVGRELAIVKTKMEEACFFAKKAMANDKENQQ